MYLTTTFHFPEDDAPKKVAQLSNRKREDIEDAVRDALERDGCIVDSMDIFDD